MDDSVLLYEHYINDDQWERTLAFPRGGLTYLISNGTIKFYAYEDYFYRNCLISMQLPIYIVDEFMHIDGEYDDLEEITDILDRIFPTNDIDAQLDKYLKKIDADLLYQPIGDYALKSDIPDVSEFVTTDELVDALEDYYTKDEADARFQPIGDYLTKASADTLYQPIGEYLTSGDTYLKGEIDDKLDEKLDASAYTPCDLSNYYTKQETSSKTQIDTALARKADNDKVYTKNESDAKYQIKLVAGDNITISGNVISAAGSSGTPVDAYTKAESDARYQPKGNYATEQWVLNQKYITSSSTVFNNYYTTANTYNKTEINQFITNIQNQISALTEALNECCSGTPTPTIEYRWVEMTGASDFVCSGYDKYSKEKKQKSTDAGTTWTDVTPAEYRQGSRLIKKNSVDCGYVPQGTKLTLVYSDLSTYEVPCDETGTICSGVSYDAVTKEMVGSGNQSISNIVSATIGDCANGIMHDAFSGCTNLQKVNLPNNFSDAFSTCHGIDVNAFENTNIRTIGLVGSGADIEYNENMIRLASKVFANCRNLTRVELPYTFTEFAPNVFSGCSNLNTIIINSTTIPILNAWAQSQYQYDGLSNIGNNTFKIYVPDNLVDEYKNSRTSQHTVGYRDWGNYADHIYPISELNS